jgi:hypothetical protein
MKERAFENKRLLLPGLAVVVGIVIILGMAAPALGHRRGVWVTAERVERALDARRGIQMTICNGLGRPLRPARPPLRRFKHFGCVIFDSRGRIWCAVIHTLHNGGLQAGRLWDGTDPRTPARACGAA